MSGRNLQVKAPPIQGPVIALEIDRTFLLQNYDSKRLAETRDVLYPRDDNVRIEPGQALLGRRDAITGKWGVVPSPSALPSRTFDLNNVDIERSRRQWRLDPQSFKVIGIASTEMTEWEKGKLMSVVSKSPSTGFLNTGSEWIGDGQTVCIRLPSHEETQQHLNRFGSVKFVTYPRDETDVHKNVYDFMEYLRLGEDIAKASHCHDKEQSLLALTSILSACSEFVYKHSVPDAKRSSEFETWKRSGYLFNSPLALFTDETNRIPLQHLLYDIVKLSETIKSKNDHMVLGMARQDIKPYEYGKIEMFV